MEQQEERSRLRIRARETVRAAAVDLTEVGDRFPMPEADIDKVVAILEHLMDTAPERYALKVASATAAAFGSQLAGVYLHGSAVLGGFDARRSDVDVLVVCDGLMTSAQQSAVAEALSERRLPCPALVAVWS